MIHVSGVRRTLVALAAALLAVPFTQSRAQTPAPAAQAPAETGPKVGEVAPDFTLPGATRYGQPFLVPWEYRRSRFLRESENAWLNGSNGGVP